KNERNVKNLLEMNRQEKSSPAARPGGLLQAEAVRPMRDPMTPTVASPIRHLIRRVVEDQRLKELPDQDLLCRFRSGHDEAALAALLRRHGPMVLDLCRNMLGNAADAEDAFQATFLVLAQRAGAIRKTSSVGSWLHGVAYRIACKAQAAFARRQKHEARASVQPPAVPSDDLTWPELHQAFHPELTRSP